MQEYWSGLPFPSPGDLPNPGIEPQSPALQADSLPSEPPGMKTMPAELLKILKDDAVKVMQSICQQIWKTQQWSQDWKRSVFILIPKKENAKNVQTTIQLHSFHMLAK